MLSARINIYGLKFHVTGYAQIDLAGRRWEGSVPTLYATFNDAADAERAAGALFDHGVARHHLTITSKRDSQISMIISRDAAAELDGENEGWPPPNSMAMAAREKALKEDQDEADASYREADNAEMSAKRGISFTTPRDVIAGALKGSAVGLGVALVIAIACLLPRVAANIASVDGALIMATLGITAGAISGALVGLLRDQGASGKQFWAPTRSSIARRYSNTRPVLLAVDVSSSAPFELEVRRVMCKYHASSIYLS